MNREKWLIDATDLLRKEVFKPQGLEVPEIRVSVGLPSKRALSTNGNRRVGECWNKETSADKVPTIFISPLEDDPIEVLSIHTHELVHAMGIHGHKQDFKVVAMQIGLEGKMTSTHAGPVLAEQLNDIAKRIGKFPHVALDVSNRKKQTTRLLKVECHHCGYIARVTAKWLDEAGAPICPTDDVSMTVS